MQLLYYSPAAAGIWMVRWVLLTLPHTQWFLLAFLICPVMWREGVGIHIPGNMGYLVALIPRVFCYANLDVRKKSQELTPHLHHHNLVLASEAITYSSQCCGAGQKGDLHNIPTSRHLGFNSLSITRLKSIHAILGFTVIKSIISIQPSATFWKHVTKSLLEAPAIPYSWNKQWGMKYTKYSTLSLITDNLRSL